MNKTGVAPVRRLAPPDRRSPRLITAGSCPGKEGCYCCVAAGVKGHGKRDGQCPHPHPNKDRQCSPPYPSNIWPCPERKSLPQDPPPVPPGHRPPRPEMCVECGRITVRRWTNPDGIELAWCAGSMPSPEPPATRSS